MSDAEVTIIGGGVAGLTAAHELIDRGYRVAIYELNLVPGGKARSLEVPEHQYPTNTDKLPLPGEHGFRFFPGFYRHLFETMSRIPGRLPNSVVSESLVNVHRLNYGRFGKNVVHLPTSLPKNPLEMGRVLFSWVSESGMNIPVEEFGDYWGKILAVAKSCDKRIEEEFEQKSWWEYLGADSKSANFKRYIGNGSRILVAADPRKASARTTARINEQLLMDQQSGSADRVLDGPTNQVWIYPWLRYLLSSGRLRYFAGVKVERVLLNDTLDRVTGIEVSTTESPDGHALLLKRCNPEEGPVYEQHSLSSSIGGDAFICCVPVEVAAEFVRSRGIWQDLARAAPELSSLDELRNHVQWMNGIVFYLKGKVQNLEGHSVYVDSPYALSSVFQQNYWHKHFSPGKFGQGNLTAILSVVVSNWLDKDQCDVPAECDIPNCGEGRKHGLSAAETFAQAGGLEKLKQEVWSDLKDSLRIEGGQILDDRNLEHYFLDPAIRLEQGTTVNAEPLLVNRANSLHLRPTASTSLPNFFLAADYVRTHTDLATMEAANEAARGAVNALLSKLGDKSPSAKIYPFERPKYFALHRALDRIIYEGQCLLRKLKNL